MQEKKALSSRGRGRLRGFLELRRPWVSLFWSRALLSLLLWSWALLCLLLWSRALLCLLLWSRALLCLLLWSRASPDPQIPVLLMPSLGQHGN